MKFEIIHPAWPKLEGQTEFNLPSLGPIQAAACAPADVDVRVLNENVQQIDFETDADLIGLSVLLTCQAPRAYELARLFREKGKTVIMGGLHPTLLPDEAKNHVDAICVGEGEGVIPRMLRDFENGVLKPVYSREGHAPPEQIPAPRRDLYDKAAHYSFKGLEMVDLVQTSRGCRFNCLPCCVPYLDERRHRIRPWESVAAELRDTFPLVFLVDNSLEQDPAYEAELFRSMTGLGKRWISHPITPEPEILRLAAESGCWYVYHAVYKVSEKIRERIRMYHDHGIGVEGTILLGMDHHDEDSIKRLIDFLLSLDLDMAEFTVLTPFPRTRVYQEMEKEGRIFDRDWRHYNAGTVVYQPRNMSPDKLQELYHYAWDAFYSETDRLERMSRLFMNVVPDIGRHRRRKRSAGAEK